MERGESSRKGIRSRKVAEAYQMFIVYALSKLHELGLLKFGLTKIASEAAGRALAKQLADVGAIQSSIVEAIALLSARHPNLDEARMISTSLFQELELLPLLNASATQAARTLKRAARPKTEHSPGPK